MLGILHSIHCRGLFHDPQCSVVLRVYTVCGGGPIPIPGPLLTYQIRSAHKTNPVTRAEELLEYQQTLAQVLTIYHHLILAQHRSDQNPSRAQDHTRTSSTREKPPIQANGVGPGYQIA